MQRRRSGRLLKGASIPELPIKEEENPANIVSRLSKKYLKNDKKTKQKPQLPPTRNLRNRSAGSIGSLSNSMNDSKQTTAEYETDDLYDFDLSEDSLSLKLFPEYSKNFNASKSSITSYGKKGSLDKQSSKVHSVKSKTKPGKGQSKSQVKPTSNEKGKSNSAPKPVKKRPFWETFTNIKPKDSSRKRRKVNSESSSRKVKSVPKLPPKPVAALRRPAAVNKTPNASSTNEQNSLDSGIFSPFILSPVPKSTSTPCNENGTHTTSTPSILLAPVPDMDLYEETPGGSFPEMQLFEEPAYESFVAPVNEEPGGELTEEEIQEKSLTEVSFPKKYTKKSSASPTKCRVPLAERNYGNISFSGLTEREKSEKKKQKRASLSKVKGKYDKLAEEINKQFEEFDSYELSVDDE